LIEENKERRKNAQCWNSDSYSFRQITPRYAEIVIALRQTLPAGSTNVVKNRWHPLVFLRPGNSHSDFHFLAAIDTVVIAEFSRILSRWPFRFMLEYREAMIEKLVNNPGLCEIVPREIEELMEAVRERR
jgi:hypothetical protein